jgi:hypothetical protein
MITTLANRTLGRIRRWLVRDLASSVESSVFLLGKMLAQRNAAEASISSLRDVEFKVTSQFGEDGIIDWLVRAVPVKSRVFIEFGVEDYSEANTRFLLQNENWRGLVIDASPDHIRRIRRSPVFWKFDLAAVAAFVDAETINDVFRAQGYSGHIGLLSVDIDGNDYWVWRAISAVDPDIVVCEYNARFGDVLPLSVPYVPTFSRTQSHYSNMYYGASIVALQDLASAKGYELVGTNSSGNNAFFVKRSLASNVLLRIDAVQIWPAQFRDERDRHGALTFRFRKQFSEVAGDLPLVNTVTGETKPAAEWGDLLSPEWHDRLPRTVAR